MKKHFHFALYTIQIVKVFIDAIEKHNGIPFTETVQVIIPLGPPSAKTMLFSFTSSRSRFRYFISVEQRGHLVEIHLYASLGEITIQQPSGTVRDREAHLLLSVKLGDKHQVSEGMRIFPSIHLPRITKALGLNVHEGCADTVQMMILIGNAFKGIADFIGVHQSDFVESFKPFIKEEVPYPDMVKALKEAGFSMEMA